LKNTAILDNDIESNKYYIGKSLGAGFLFCLCLQVYSFQIETIIRDILLVNGINPHGIMCLSKIISLFLILAIGFFCIKAIKNSHRSTRVLTILIALYFIGNIIQCYYVALVYENFFFQNEVYMDTIEKYGEYTREFFREPLH
jgi:hypothetical protein